MPDELDVVSSMASLDAIDTNGVAVSGVAGLTAIEVVHGKGSVTGDLVEALTIGDGLFHRILVVEDLVAAHDRLYSAGETQPAEAVVEYLVALKRSRGIVGDLDASSQPVKDAIPAQDGMALRGYQHSSLGVSKDVVLLQNTLATIEDADTAVTPIKDLVPLERGVGIGLDPHTRHGVIEDLVLFQQT